jgi:hypothetical protein
MASDELDRILRKEPAIVPSSGFVGSVMEAVQREATAPPAIPFPWSRALPGMAVGVLALGWAIVVAANVLGRAAAVPPGPVALPPVIASLVEGMRVPGAGWITLALVLSLVSVKLSSRLTA